MGVFESAAHTHTLTRELASTVTDIQTDTLLYFGRNVLVGETREGCGPECKGWLVTRAGVDCAVAFSPREFLKGLAY